MESSRSHKLEFGQTFRSAEEGTLRLRLPHPKDKERSQSLENGLLWPPLTPFVPYVLLMAPPLLPLAPTCTLRYKVARGQALYCVQS